uniref:hypothetical protein n=1 Tax=Alloprevotella sp. TaxID=1872471 RepID=UPI00402A58E8
MKATATTTPTASQVSAADVARSLGRCAALCLVYVLQTIVKALDLAQRAAMGVCQWLNSRHNFTDEEDPVIMTGWQYLGFGVVVMFVATIVSIKW